MIRFSKIDDKLTTYKEHEVVLFGAGFWGRDIKKNLEFHGIKVSFFCDNNEKKWGSYMDGIEILSPVQLRERYSEEILIQISVASGQDVEMQLRAWGMGTFISFQEYIERLSGLYIYKTLPESVKIYDNFFSRPSYLVGQTRYDCLNYAARVKYFEKDSYNILCMPPKTGNYTLLGSLGKSGAEFVRFGHSFNRMFDGLKEFIGDKKIKIVTSVRDPIAQNISLFFQITTNLCYCDIPEYWTDGGDVQAVWDLWIAHELKEAIPLYAQLADQGKLPSFSYMEGWNKEQDNVIVIQDFFEKNFKRFNGINVLDYEFDKEQGYVLIQQDNVEVFIYQLERLNDVKDQLALFLGIENLELINGNEAKQKWYAPVYRQALRELKLDKEYFEYCYNSPCVQHFYSEADIESFKNRWRKHVKE